MLPHLLSTGDKIQGYRIVENLGMVHGMALRVRTMESTAAWHLQSLLGARTLTYQKIAQAARQKALEEMIKNAEDLGASAIIDIRYDSAEIARAIGEVFCYGKAVRVLKEKQENV